MVSEQDGVAIEFPFFGCDPIFRVCKIGIRIPLRYPVLALKFKYMWIAGGEDRR